VRLSEAYNENLNEDRPILSAAKMWPNDFSQYKFCADIRVSSLEMGVKQQWGNRKRRFSMLSDATSSETWEIRPTSLFNPTVKRLSTEP